MNALKNAFFLFLLTLSFIEGSAQQQAMMDSLKNKLARATTPAEKVHMLDILSKALMDINREESEKVGKQLMEVAEESRDRKLMIDAYMSNAWRYNYAAATGDYRNRSIEYYNKALNIAKQNRMDDVVGSIMLMLARIYIAIPDMDKALNYITEGFTIISTLKNDSLKVEAYQVFGRVYLRRNDKILALRNYLTALQLAEEIKNHLLVRECNIRLSEFYSSIGDYDKAIDYYTRALKLLNEMRVKSTPFNRVEYLREIGNLYTKKKSYDFATSYYNKALALADSLKFPILKLNTYLSVLDQYTTMDKPPEALAYFNSEQGKELQQYLNTVGGLSGVVDLAYAELYTKLNRFDSSRFYFNKAAPYFAVTPIEAFRVEFYSQYALLYKKTGVYDSAIAFYLKVQEIAERTGSLEKVEESARQLDSLYMQKNDFKLARQYNSIAYRYKDSIEKINKEKELSQLEASDEQLRLQRIEKEKEEAKRKRHNIQYMGITIGITILFIALVMLGMFRVSRTTIKMIGFFAFLMFFEFIFLIFKKNINSVTEGEPWKDLLFMIGLAALLLPLHHWLEHKVIHYLTSHNRLTQAGSQLKTRLFKRKKAGNN